MGWASHTTPSDLTDGSGIPVDNIEQEATGSRGEFRRLLAQEYELHKARNAAYLANFLAISKEEEIRHENTLKELSAGRRGQRENRKRLNFD